MSSEKTKCICKLTDSEFEKQLEELDEAELETLMGGATHMPTRILPIHPFPAYGLPHRDDLIDFIRPIDTPKPHPNPFNNLDPHLYKGHN
jgi:hypothetical protein